jgi:hypothetical protein
MAVGKLYIHFDTFSPSVYKPSQPVEGAETYESERQYIYVVANAYWLPPEEPGNQGGLANYFEWTGKLLDDTSKVALLDEPLLRSMGVETERLVPVPFPPETTLKFKATWEPSYEEIGAVDLSGKLGGYTVTPSQPDLTDPLQLPAEMWPLFAIANFSVPTVHRWMDMTAQQQIDTVNWCCTIIPLLNKNADSLTLCEKEAYTLYKNDSVLDPKEPQEPYDLDPNSEKVLHRKWREKLLSKEFDKHAMNIPLAGLIFEKLVLGGSTLKVVGTAPKFLVDPAKLIESPDLVLSNAFLKGTPDEGKALTGMSYHRQLWESMKVMVGAPFTEGEAASVREERKNGEQTVTQALGQLFGYGERLRWRKPHDAKGTARFMMPREESKRVETLTSNNGILHHVVPDSKKMIDDWFGTNAHSLLGQVFRVIGGY